jgi:hypothetical protein
MRSSEPGHRAPVAAVPAASGTHRHSASHAYNRNQSPIHFSRRARRSRPHRIFMSFNSDHYAERERRVRQAASSLVALMNDTKWREVFSCACRHSLWFQISWLHDSSWPSDSLQHPVAENWLDTNGIRDPGIGGPCFYRDILWIRFPRVRRDLRFGPARQPVQQFVDDLASLGVLPITETDEYVEIRGYQSVAS